MFEDVPLSKTRLIIVGIITILFIAAFLHLLFEIDSSTVNIVGSADHNMMLSASQQMKIKNEKLEEEKKTLGEEKKQLEKDLFQYNKFREVLAKHDMKDYDREHNNCYQQSQQIQKELLTHGIESSIFINEDRTHAWVGAWIEATDGSFNVRGNQGPLAEVRDDSLKVVCN